MENRAFAPSFGANAPFSIIFPKVFKTLLISFSKLSKYRNLCHDLIIANEVKG